MEQAIDKRVGYHIGVVGHLIQNLYNEKLSELGLTVSQAKVIYLLHCHGTQLQVDLQKKLYIKASTMNGIIDSMLKKGLIVKKDSDIDRRSKTIILTEKGRQLEEQLWNDMGFVEEKLTEGFTEEEKQVLLVWLKKLKHNLHS